MSYLYTRYANGKPGRAKRSNTPIIDPIRRERRVVKQYGIDALLIYKELVAECKGACVICGCTDKVLHLDHNHITNTLRGMLCGSCNRGLGMFKDSAVLLANAINYLHTRK